MKTASILFLGFLLCACQTSVSKGFDQCDSPLIYQDQSFSLSGSYGLIGLGGEYKTTSNIQNVEKQVQIYFAEAQFLCEQNQLGNLSTKDYIKERKELSRTFAEVLPGLKATISAEYEKPKLDIQSLWLFSESNNIQFRESDTVDNLMDYQCPDDAICELAVVPYEKNWQETLLSCSLSVLNYVSASVSTKLGATEQHFRDPKTKKVLKVKSTTTSNSAISSFQTKLDFAQQTDLVSISDIENNRSTTEIRIKETLKVPANIFDSNEPLIRVSSGFQNGSESFQSRSGWLSKPELKNNNSLNSYISYLENSHLPIKRISLVDEGFACQIVTSEVQSN